MGRLHGAGADGDWTGPHLVDVEELQGGAGADDVDDGVEGAHLVEVDLVRWDAMETPFDLGERREHRQRSALDPWRERAAGENLTQLGERARMVHILRSVDRGAGRPQASALHRLGPQLPAGQTETVEDGPNLIDWGAGIEQCAQRHVAGDAGEAVEPGDHR